MSENPLLIKLDRFVLHWSVRNLRVVKGVQSMDEFENRTTMKVSSFDEGWVLLSESSFHVRTMQLFLHDWSLCPLLTHRHSRV